MDTVLDSSEATRNGRDTQTGKFLGVIAAGLLIVSAVNIVAKSAEADKNKAILRDLTDLAEAEVPGFDQVVDITNRGSYMNPITRESMMIELVLKDDGSQCLVQYVAEGHQATDVRFLGC